MKSEFEIAITQLCADRNLSPQVILKAIEDALVSAYKRNYGANQNISVTLDPRTGQARVFVKKLVVEKLSDDRLEMPLAEARTYKADAVPGDMVDTEVKPRNFGRIAAQTAKQVIMQRIREAERDTIYLEYADRTGEIVNGVVRNIDARTQNVTLSLGKAEALLNRSEQIPGEHYRFNQRLRVYVVEVGSSGHGPQIAVSRTHRGLLKRLLELEVPEIFNGAVEIKSIAREPGSRSKVAVAALQHGVDPVGSCVGMRGVRIQNIVNELNGEKIDVVEWSSDVSAFIGNALSPAKVISVHLVDDDKSAKVVVPDRSLSLAIGKEGQNARLAAKLSGWRIDIRSETEAAAESERLAVEAREAAVREAELLAARQEAAALLAAAEASLREQSEQLEPEVEAEQASAEAEVAAEQVPAEAEVAEEQPLELVSPGAPAEPVTQPEGELAVEPEAKTAPVPAEDLAVPEALLAMEPAVEPAVAPSAEPGPSAGYEPEFEEDGSPEAEPEGDEGPKKGKGKGKKDRKRVLEFDERLGRVVARRLRKPGRRGALEGEGDDWPVE